MLKTVLAIVAGSTVTAAAFVYVGRSAYSSNIQVNAPFGSAIKVTQDPGNIWSWHHSVTNPAGSTTFDVLVDINGDQVMDTMHPAFRVLITDFQLVAPANSVGLAWVIDSVGKRFAVGVGGYQTSGPVQTVSLTTPIALPVGSSLQVELNAWTSGVWEINLIGRIVNL